ncbi:hemerythrin domain-containing protein [Nocardia sp. CDC159]|uniref:Hemerythrin domain-containing protein n=1 Tax=Nocardia pulmonis TaxID=2951408 RepID=A0A9X2E2Q3_9NOCA|nr:MULTISPECIES: hemerythrin domain-containing protein [Nocardia]MCM6772023.1 hemerythrin domain-containing protein [Nocardia pulmonis]MCM6785319.1 hemerythrin domain-containing protein [Nocardia sp. CDC159]
MTQTAADAAELLVRQHRRIAGLLGEVRVGGERGESFAELVRLMAAHESVEESLVHSAVGRSGAENVDARLHEERQLLGVLAELYELGVDHPEFGRKFDRFADMVSMHLASEEVQELPILRESASTADARRIAAAIEMVETFIPSRGTADGERPAVAPPLPLFTRLCDAVDAGLGRA